MANLFAATHLPPRRRACLGFGRWLKCVAGCAALLLVAQFLGAAPNARFAHFSVEQGLSQSTVQAIVQDRVGFLWLGTEEGLNRYDGYSFTIFRHDPKIIHSLPNDRINALHEDRRQRLWIGTEVGLCWFDRPTEKFTPIEAIKGRVTSLAEEPDGTLWVAVEGYGICARNPDTGALTWHQKQAAVPASFSSYVPSAIVRDRRGQIWIGTRDAGVDLFAGDDRFIHFRHDPANPESLASNEVWGIAEDRVGNLWVATYGAGLGVLDPNKGTVRRFRHRADDPQSLPTDLVTSVFVDRAGAIWVGTDGAGVLKYDPASGRFVSFRHDAADAASLSQNVVRTFGEDAQGQLWVGTFLGGAELLKRPRRAFNYFTHSAKDLGGLSDPTTLSFLEDAQGRLWVGLERGWLNRFDPKTGEFAAFRYPMAVPGGPALLALHQDRRGRLWVGTHLGGLGRFDADSGTFSIFRHEPGNPRTIANDEIWSIVEDETGAMWLATNGGLDRFDPDLGVVTAHYDTPSGPNGITSGARALLYDRLGNLWIGAISGLHVLHPGSNQLVHFWHNDSDLQSLPHNSVVALKEDAEGQIWLGTYGGGLIRFEPGRKRFTAFKKFPSNVIYSVQDDAAGRLWVSTNHGLSRFDPVTEAIENFDLTNGLQSVQFSLGASRKLRSGRLVFGSADGFYEFDSPEIKADNYAPRVALTGLRRFNDPVQLATALTNLREVTLLPADKMFTFEFSALDYTFPRRNRYAYLMEGLSDRWIDLGSRREVTFTSLEPGSYKLRIKASNSDGIWGEQSALVVRVTVRPAFWQTWWFRGGSIAGLGLLVLTIHRRRVGRLTADIAERKRSELALRQAEEKYRELVEDMDDIIFATDEDGFITYISPVTETVLGYKPSEIVGKPFVRLVAPDDAAKVTDAMRQPTLSRIEPLEHRVLTKTGKILWMHHSSRAILQDDRAGGFRGVLTDITDRKKLEEQLRQSQKMEAIGQLAGGIAHDFNNLLTVIIGYTNLMLERRTSQDEDSMRLAEVKDAARRAAALTQQLLAFSRRQMLQPKVLDLNELVRMTEKMLQRVIGEDIHLSIILPPVVGHIKADPIQIEQTILNLAINARDAMPRGGKLLIGTADVTLDAHYAKEHADLKPGAFVKLTVTDTGVGMSPEVQAHIFEPFFTTKGVGKGTGLGLSTIYGIVKQSGGHITVASTLGAGTTFEIYFPAVAPVAPPAARLPARSDPTGNGTVLLVEDTAIVRKTVRQMLQQSGYTVLEAASGEEALREYAKHPDPIRLLLTDVIMPGMNGRELAERLTPSHSTMKVLFMSGYTDDAILRHGGLGFGRVLIEKPFTPEALARKVEEVLGSHTDGN
jgi:PAS domain S-box-containing protein